MGADVPPPAHGGGCGPLATTAAWLKWRINDADCRQEARRRGTPGRGRQLLRDVDAGPSITKHWQPGGLAWGRIPRGSVPRGLSRVAGLRAASAGGQGVGGTGNASLVLGLGWPSGFLRQDGVWSLRGWRVLVVQRVGWPGPACLCVAVACFRSGCMGSLSGRSERRPLAGLGCRISSLLRKNFKATLRGRGALVPSLREWGLSLKLEHATYLSHGLIYQADSLQASSTRLLHTSPFAPAALRAARENTALEWHTAAVLSLCCRQVHKEAALCELPARTRPGRLAGQDAPISISVAT
eukprot:366182-Chlamydomonas_euryale.AAC.16